MNHNTTKLILGLGASSLICYGGAYSLASAIPNQQAEYRTRMEAIKDERGDLVNKVRDCYRTTNDSGECQVLSLCYHDLQQEYVSLEEKMAKSNQDKTLMGVVMLLGVAAGFIAVNGYKSYVPPVKVKINLTKGKQ